MLAGIMFAFAQDDLKRMLAFSSVSQIGYVVMGLGSGLTWDFRSTILPALLKGMLFLCTGALLYTSSTIYISGLRGKETRAEWIRCYRLISLSAGARPGPRPSFMELR